MKSQISVRKALSNPQLLGHLTGESWAPWRTILIAAMGEALSEDERADLHTPYWSRRRATFTLRRIGGGSRKTRRKDARNGNSCSLSGCTLRPS